MGNLIKWISMYIGEITLAETGDWNKDKTTNKKKFYPVVEKCCWLKDLPGFKNTQFYKAD